MAFFEKRMMEGKNSLNSAELEEGVFEKTGGSFFENMNAALLLKWKIDIIDNSLKNGGVYKGNLRIGVRSLNEYDDDESD